MASWCGPTDGQIAPSQVRHHVVTGHHASIGASAPAVTRTVPLEIFESSLAPIACVDADPDLYRELMPPET